MPVSLAQGVQKMLTKDFLLRITSKGKKLSDLKLIFFHNPIEIILCLHTMLACQTIIDNSTEHINY